MLACVDVDYRDDGAVAACVLFRAWADHEPARELIQRVEHVAPYEPGAFYKRELPCLQAVLALAQEPLEGIVVDGYVWLRGPDSPGLGAHLYEALGRSVPVIGVAKTCFVSATEALPVCRGASTKPLHVTAVGVDRHEAAAWIAQMHGEHRLPTLLKRVDALCRAR